MSGLLVTPLLGCVATTALDWCHAWAILGQWANFVAFPLPAKGSHDGDVFPWARHGHSERLREQFKSSIPSLIGWAHPVFEQGALPVGKFPSGLLDRCIAG